MKITFLKILLSMAITVILAIPQLTQAESFYDQIKKYKLSEKSVTAPRDSNVDTLRRLQESCDDAKASYYEINTAYQAKQAICQEMETAKEEQG